VRYADVASELRSRTVPLPFVASGARRFVAGLAKKVLVANVAGELFHTLLKGGTLGALGAWGALVAFAIQIYFDFSGYSDMAIGLGAIFGFHFPENFNYPYIATSFRDFWRRWHVTLSSFFKTYVYIPLGGSRHGVFRTVVALFVVWSLTGLWHGAAFNFLLWGVYYFLLLVIERFLWRGAWERLPLTIRHTFTLLGILLGWLIFAFDGTAPYLALGMLPQFLASLLGANGAVANNDLYHCLRHLPFLLIAALGATPIPRRAFEWVSVRLPLLSLLLPLAALLLSLAALSGASFQPFLYFRF
jgi:alginate O-acetyltransferase complex protein AlgI